MKPKKTEFLYLHPDESREKRIGMIGAMEIDESRYDQGLDQFRKLIELDVKRFKRIWKIILKNEPMSFIDKVEMIRDIDYEKKHPDMSLNQINALQIIRKVEWLRGVPQVINVIQERFLKETSRGRIDRDSILKNLDLILYLWYSSYHAIHSLFDELLFLHNPNARTGARMRNGTDKRMKSGEDARKRSEADAKRRACIELWKRKKAENPGLKKSEFASWFWKETGYTSKTIRFSLTEWIRRYSE